MPYAPGISYQTPQRGSNTGLALLQFFTQQSERRADEAKREQSAGRAADAWYKSLPEGSTPVDPTEFANKSAREKADWMRGTIAAEEFRTQRANLDLNQTNAKLNQQRAEAMLQELAGRRATGQALAASGDRSSRFGLDLPNPQGPWSPEMIGAAPRDPARAFLEAMAQYPDAAQANDLPQLLNALANMRPTKAGWNLTPGQVMRGPDGTPMVAVSPNSFQVLNQSSGKPVPTVQAPELYSDDAATVRAWLEKMTPEQRDQAIETRHKLRLMEGRPDPLTALLVSMFGGALGSNADRKPGQTAPTPPAPPTARFIIDPVTGQLRRE